MKRYVPLFENNSDLFKKALGLYQKYLKASKEDDKVMATFTTSKETQRYNRKFNVNEFQANTDGLFRKLKSMESELSKSFVNKMIKMWNSRDSKNMLKASGYTGEIELMITIIQEILKKI